MFSCLVFLFWCVFVGIIITMMKWKKHTYTYTNTNTETETNTEMKTQTTAKTTKANHNNDDEKKVSFKCMPPFSGYAYHDLANNPPFGTQPLEYCCMSHMDCYIVHVALLFLSCSVQLHPWPLLFLVLFLCPLLVCLHFQHSWTISSPFVQTGNYLNKNGHNYQHFAHDAYACVLDWL